MTRPITAPQTRALRRDIIRRVVATVKVLHGHTSARSVAAELGLSPATWTNTRRYGGTVPAHAILRLMAAHGVEAGWLLHGNEPMFRGDEADNESFDSLIERFTAVIGPPQRFADRPPHRDR
jgi:hypothetical protein